jgi:hypothetical protein
LIVVVLRATFGSSSSISKGGAMKRSINFQSMSDDDKKTLKALLEDKKKALQTALRHTDRELAALAKKRPAHKAAKKAKK